MYHLCRKTKDGQLDTGYLEPDKRNIRAIKLRGEKSDGLAIPLSCLEPFGDISSLSIGDTVEVPYGLFDCIHDPGYLLQECPEWYKELYGDMPPEEVVQKECLRYCKDGSDYDDEDK